LPISTDSQLTQSAISWQKSASGFAANKVIKGHKNQAEKVQPPLHFGPKRLAFGTWLNHISRLQKV